MSVIDTNDTPRLLEEWALWSRVNAGSKTGYPSSCPFVGRKGGIALAITDEEAQEVDAAVSRLIQRDKEMGETLKLYYFSGCNASLVARDFKMNRKRAIVLVQCGVAWIDAKLEAA